MSYEAMTWAVKIIEQNKAWKTPVRFVLLIMANRADEDGLLYPSVRWIMERTALAESTIRQATRDLQQLGLLIKEPRQRELGGQTSNEYRLNMSQFVLKLDVVPGPYHVGGTVHGTGVAVHAMDRAPPSDGPQETKEETKEKKWGGRSASPRATRIPDGFGISESVRAWAKAQGYEPHLAAHLAYFLDDAKSRATARYVDWDAAFRKAIAADWGDIRRNAVAAEKRGERPAGAPAKPWWEDSQRVDDMARRLEVDLWQGRNVEPWATWRDRVKARAAEATA